MCYCYCLSLLSISLLYRDSTEIAIVSRTQMSPKRGETNGNNLQFLQQKQLLLKMTTLSAAVFKKTVSPRIKNGMIFWILPTCDSLTERSKRRVFFAQDLWGLVAWSLSGHAVAIRYPTQRGRCRATLGVNFTCSIPKSNSSSSGKLTLCELGNHHFNWVNQPTRRVCHHFFPMKIAMKSPVFFPLIVSRLCSGA